jgi:murein DD-endopeptidase MepM/ murein hydrolase activator NlpD
VDSLSEILQDQFFTADQNYRYILELDSLPTNIRYAGTGGTDPYASSPRSYYNKNYAELNHKITNLKDKIVIQDESYEEIMKAALDKKKQLAHFPGITPVKSDTYVWISSFFGTRNDPFTFQHRTHLGLDFVAPFNTKVYATANGTVTLVKHSRRGYGNEIVIDHGFGYKTRYAHLNKTLIQEGQEVERGELIGLMGNTGRSTGTHLHYEVHLYNNPVNPLYFFADDLGPEEFEQLTVKQNN